MKVKKIQPKYLIIYAVLILTAFSAPAAASDLANSGKLGLQIYSIDRILRLDEGQIDLCTAVLAVSRQWSASNSLKRYRDKVDGMAEEILDRLRKKNIRADYRAIPVINEYLFDELGFKSVDNADDPQDLFLHSVIDRKKGYCLSLSVLYLSIGERIGLPLHGVVVPGHFFVRYDDGQKRFNIETTSNGNIAPDEHYLEKFKPPKGDDFVYMKNLGSIQTLGCFLNNLGNAYTDAGDNDSAMVELERAVRINPSLAEAHTNLGNIYLSKELISQALSEYQKSLKIIPDDYKTINNLANAYSSGSQYNRAVSEYRRAIALKPDFVDAHRNLANAFRRMGQPINALAELKKAADISPGDYQTYRMFADVYSEMENYDAAIRYYYKTLQLQPDSPGAYSALGYCYLKSNKFAEAVDSYIAAVSRNPSDTNAYFGLAQSYNQLGMVDNEINTYLVLLTVDTQSVGAMQNLGNAYISKQLYEQAIEQYSKAIQTEPSNSAVRYNRGVAYSNLKMHQQALADYLEVIKNEPANASAHNAAAISCYMLRQYDKSRRYALKAKELGFDVQKELLENPSESGRKYTDRR